MKSKVLCATVAVGVFALMAGGASAGGPAKTTVKLSDHSDVAGKVKSSRNSCVDERKVKLMQKLPGDDDKVGMDTAEDDGSFSFGNPGLDKGKYYVKAPAISGCKAGTSKTFEVT